MKFIITAFTIINALAYILMRVDKNNARRGSRRISEASLLSLAVIGGSIGILAGMLIHHHKTKKPLFYIGVPLILVLEILVIIVL